MFLKIISFAGVVLVTCGYLARRKKSLHIKLMISAFLIDMGLLLYIEITRQAIMTALHPPHPFVVFHVLVSSAVVILYFIQIYLGRKLALSNSEDNIRKKHRRIGPVFLAFRYINFGTSLFIENFVKSQ